MVLGLALAVTAFAGCTQTCFMNKEDLDAFTKRNILPPNWDRRPDLSIVPDKTEMPPPPDVNNPEREPHYLTLHEAIARALENGVIGSTSVRNLGVDTIDLTYTANGGSFGLPLGTLSIRVFALEPAIAQANIEAQLARFDVTARAISQFTTSDPNPLAPGRFQSGQFFQGGMSLEKPLSTGGIAAIDFGSPTTPNLFTGGNLYNNFTNQSFLSGAVNPTYTPDLHFVFNQPLLQGSGVDYNLLAPVHPNSNQTQNFGVGGTGSAFQGILVSRVNFDQTRIDLEYRVAFMLVNVETAYWNLYGAFVNLYSSEQALRQAFEAWRISKAKYEAGSVAITQFAQTRGQYEQFRGDRITALGQVLEAERTLRHLIGLPVEDGKRLVPVDTPTLTPYIPDWHTAANETLALRPELINARQDLKLRQLELTRIRNQLLPQLNLNSNYNIHGLGTSLSGDGVVTGTGATGTPVTETSNALRSIAGLHNADFTLGLTFAMPIGYRFANAQVRQAHLRLAQGYLGLKEQEQRALMYLAQQYRTIIEKYQAIQARRAQRQAFAEQVEARFKEFVAGKTTADFLLEAQRQWAAALSSEFQEIVNYNNALARFQFAKGTMLQHDNVIISEGMIPQCAQISAVEHERQRSHALVLRERAAPIPAPNCGPGNQNCGPGCAVLPNLPEVSAPSLPALMGGAPPVPEINPTSPKDNLQVRNVPALTVNDKDAPPVRLPQILPTTAAGPSPTQTAPPAMPTLPLASSALVPTTPPLPTIPVAVPPAVVPAVPPVPATPVTRMQ